MGLKYKLDCTNCQTLGLSVFCTLKHDELETLNRYKNSFLVKKGQMIFYEDNEPQGMYCVHQGKAKIFKTTDSGDTQILRLAKDGDIIGYRSLLAGEPFKAAAEALEDSVVCLIPRNYIFELLNRNLQLSLRLMEHFARDLRNAEKKNVDLLHKSSRERLAEALILMKDSFGVDEEGYINITLSREDMGNITGMATETVVRALHEWEETQLVDLDKKRIRIRSMEKMLDMARVND